MDPLTRQISQEIERRRTFAIISHPDAGKTTLTEKILLFGGAVREAGAVRSQRAARHATSDWLEIERQRGISVSSSVMHAEYEGTRINILDTPGHRDFSEDTYRTLLAADSVVMLIDAAKGVEPQTRRLFEVCRMRGLPIFTFINKMDRAGLDPLELLSEIEDVLGIEAIPVNWAVGSGREFRGVYDRMGKKLLLFRGGNHGASELEETEIVGDVADPDVRSGMGPEAEITAEALELLDGAGTEFDLARVRAGKQTPVFFGSALTNYGVRPFLESFLTMAPCPGAQLAAEGPVDPVETPFSAFVFKIQANMDPDHRDRVAFVRICSGRYVQGLVAKHQRTGKPIRLAKSTLLMGRDREGVTEAFPGDVIGLFDPGMLRIGDTISEGGEVSFVDFPAFAPEHFMRIELGLVTKRKALAKGLEQLTQEGAVQLFQEQDASSPTIVGAVGPLQFDVLKHRMAAEYKVELRLSPLTFKVARWPQAGFDDDMVRHSQMTKLVYDRDGRAVVLAQSQAFLDSLVARHPELELADTPDPKLFQRTQNAA